MGGFFTAFGVDWKILSFQLLNFAILYYVFNRFIWPVLIKALEKRRQAIEQGLEDAKLAQAKLAQAEQTSDEILAAAKQSAKEIHDSAKSSELQDRERFLQALEAEKQLLLADAREEAGRERQQLLRTAQRELAQKVVTNLEDFMLEDASAKQKQALTDRFLNNL